MTRTVHNAVEMMAKDRERERVRIYEEGVGGGAEAGGLEEGGAEGFANAEAGGGAHSLQ
jgi:hypothetical protein